MNTLNRNLLKRWQINVGLTARQAAEQLNMDLDDYIAMIDGSMTVPNDLLTAIGQQVVMLQQQKEVYVIHQA